MDSILMFDDSPPPTDDIIDMMADASMESFLGLNDSFIFDVDNTTALDELLESYNDIDTADFGEMYPFNTSHLLPYPSLSTLGQKETTMFEFITVGIMLTMVSMFGLAGNIVAIIVLSSPVMRGSFSSLLIGLSSFDLVYLVVGIAIFGLPALSDYYHKKLLHYVVPICFGFGHIGRVGSVFITMSVTIERYFAIVHPLKHFSGKRMLLITPMILSVLYNIPKFFEFQWSENGLVETTLRTNKVYTVYYIFWSKFLVVELGPYMTILILNIRIIQKIYKSNKFRRKFTIDHTSVEISKNREKNKEIDRSEAIAALNPEAAQSHYESEMTAKQRREANLGIVLILISLLFIVCQSVKIFPDIYEVLFCRIGSSGHNAEGHCKNNSTIDIIIDVSHLMLAINSSVNVIIYTLRGEKFREVLKKKLGFGHEKKEVSPNVRNGGTGGNKNTTTMLVLHAQTGNAIVPSSIIISGKRSQNNDEKKRPVDRKDTQSTLGSESLNYPPNPFKTSKAQVDHGDLV